MRSHDALLIVSLLVGFPVLMCSDKMVVVVKSPYGTTKDGQKVDKYTLKNKNGVEVDVITFGAVTVSIKCPDRCVISHYKLTFTTTHFHFRS